MRQGDSQNSFCFLKKALFKVKGSGHNKNKLYKFLRLLIQR